jgi:hypothetical protein
MSTRTFKSGDLVELVPSNIFGREDRFAVPWGSRAVVQDPPYRRGFQIDWLYVSWLDPETRQSHGGYYPENFKLVVEDTFEKDGIE